MKKKISRGKSKEKPTRLKSARKVSRIVKPKRRIKAKAKRRKGIAPARKIRRVPKRANKGKRSGEVSRKTLKARAVKTREIAKRLVRMQSGIRVERIRLDKVESAIDIIGESKLKRGRIVLGGTPWIRPDKGGFIQIYEIARQAVKR